MCTSRWDAPGVDWAQPRKSCWLFLHALRCFLLSFHLFLSAPREGQTPKAVKDGVGGIVTSLRFSSRGSLVLVFLPKMVGDMASQLCPCLPESHQWSRGGHKVAAVREEGRCFGRGLPAPAPHTVVLGVDSGFRPAAAFCSCCPSLT